MGFTPKFNISLPIAASLISIERARGFLEAVKLSDEWIARMQTRSLILEAHHTTHIEGSHLSLDQSEKLLSGKKVAKVDEEDVKELLNYRNAFEFVEYASSQETMTEGMIREIHKRLVDNVRENSAQPGKYRIIQNYVADSKTNDVIYMPPPAYEVPILMAELVHWLQNERSIPAVIVAGIAQFQFVHIHPFLDGNGRTARLLSTLCLYRAGYDFKKLYSISEYYDGNRQDYYQAIRSVRNNDMDMTTWLEYFTKALEAQIHKIQWNCVMKLDALALKHKLSDRQKRALENLLEKDVFSIQEYESYCHGVNRRTLQRDLAELIEKGLVLQKGVKKAASYKLNFLD